MRSNSEYLQQKIKEIDSQLEKLAIQMHDQTNIDEIVNLQLKLLAFKKQRIDWLKRLRIRQQF